MTALVASEADIARFMSYVDKLPNGCHFWSGGRSRGKGNKKWYGSFHLNGRTVRAHKFACEVLGHMGPLPPGHDRDHTCVFSLCVNPEHLEYVPKEKNNALRDLRRAAAQVLQVDYASIEKRILLTYCYGELQPPAEPCVLLNRPHILASAGY
jgi:hypothetical protein